MKKISIITPVLPTKSQHILECSNSVEEFKKAVSHIFDTEWILSIDGPGEVSNIDKIFPDKTIQSSSNKGVSVARNIALFNSTGDYIIPLDADDTFNIKGCIETLEKLNSGYFDKYKWIGLNRKLKDGSKTPHWNDNETIFKKGDLASNWTAPFKFHPNTLIVNAVAAKKIGGWPGIVPNEDLAFVMFLSENYNGIIYPSHIINYRIWDGQTINEANYTADKKIAFSMIEGYVNVLRKENNLPLIQAPVSGGAYGKDKK